jgi:hypothetical protein
MLYYITTLLSLTDPFSYAFYFVLCSKEQKIIFFASFGKNSKNIFSLQSSGMCQMAAKNASAKGNLGSFLTTFYYQLYSQFPFAKKVPI